MIAHVINPGTSGVKLACAVIEPSANPALPGQLRVTLTRDELPLDAPPTAADIPGLAQRILTRTQDWAAPDAIVGRGGLIGKVSAGTYPVTPELAEYAVQGERAQLPGNLGGPLALAVAQERGVPAYIVDPQSIDELLPEARETGLRGLRRGAQFHALNTRVVARRAAHEIGKRFPESRIVVAHLGATTSVTAFENGRAIDTSGTGPDGGPMGALQSGPLPARMLLALVREHGEDGALHLLAAGGGFLSLAGSANLRDLEARAPSDPDVQAAAAAFVHQVCRAIGALTGALSGRPDAIAITGGIAKWDDLVDRIERRLAWIAPVLVIPGELELEALAEGAGRVLLGLEAAREWKAPAPAGS
ncbi:butyrate kinase [Deinococcus metalli]|uniref:Probable butyrate kinase n=1 Tax=Deinococcus metalli TaxID=1141878 RepID=A0A7W8NPF8_9DEIO|nr:butyrate kinase [Deinococcus metalli]MBB5374793.1 butyrate kinase [Deinococcus metalli]GHF33674.1 putative butyrate kinase [Deinococcus metalli]